MGLAKKGTRNIDIEETSYRWVVSPDSDFMVLVVELSNSPGQRLEAQFEYKNKSGEETVISPALVKNIIIGALSEGWEPEILGLAPFRISGAKYE